MINTLSESNLQELKRSLIEIGGNITLSEERKAKAIAETEKQLLLAKRLTAFVYSSAVKTFFCQQRNLCLGMLKNSNKAAILRKIVTRHLAGAEDNLYLQYHNDIGYSFYHSAKQFAAELFISTSAVYKLIKSLETEGWIQIYLKQDLFGRKIYHLKLNIQNFIKQAETFMSSHLSFFDKCVYQDLPNVSYINKQKKETINLEGKELNKKSIIEKIKTSEDKPSQSEESTFIDAKNINLADDLSKIDKVPRLDEKVNENCDRHTEKKTLAEEINTAKEDGHVFCGKLPTENVTCSKCFVNLDSKYSKSKEEMGVHKPEGDAERSWALPRKATASRSDRYFGNNRQQPQIREKAKMYSLIGASGFEDLEQMQECQQQLIEYFALQITPAEAYEKVSWMLKREKEGERSPYIKDFLNGLPVGTWCKAEWEIKPGVIAPVFTAYLRHKLRRDGDTHAQTVEKVYWHLKRQGGLADDWAECKRLLDIEKPRLEKAIVAGQNPASIDVPLWIIEVFRPEIKIEDVVETAQALGAIATQYHEAVAQAQKAIAPAQENIPVSIPGGINKLIDLQNMLGVLPAADIKEIKLTPEQEVDQLLDDPITRPRGVMLAKKHRFPLLLDANGTAIAIDYAELEDSRKREKVDKVMDRVTSTQEPSPAETKEPTEIRCAAHDIYQPEQIEKVSKSAWDEAIAKSKSKFLRSTRAWNKLGKPEHFRASRFEGSKKDA